MFQRLIQDLARLCTRKLVMTFHTVVELAPTGGEVNLSVMIIGSMWVPGMSLADTATAVIRGTLANLNICVPLPRYCKCLVIICIICLLVPRNLLSTTSRLQLIYKTATVGKDTMLLSSGLLEVKLVNQYKISGYPTD